MPPSKRVTKQVESTALPVFGAESQEVVVLRELATLVQQYIDEDVDMKALEDKLKQLKGIQNNKRKN
jgi:hypothetical protein